MASIDEELSVAEFCVSAQRLSTPLTSGLTNFNMSDRHVTGNVALGLLVALSLVEYD